MRISLEPAVVLHTKPFRDTSLFVDIFSLHYGRMRLVARGARRVKSSLHELLGYFSPLLISWAGKGSLPTLTKVDKNSSGFILSGDNLLRGIHVNELVCRLLEEHVAYEKLYNGYFEVIKSLSFNQNTEVQLLLFKKLLLTEIGYGISLDKDLAGNLITVGNYYNYIHNLGFQALKPGQCNDNINCFAGASLLALRENVLEKEQDIAEAKNLLNLAIEPLLKQRYYR